MDLVHVICSYIDGNKNIDPIDFIQNSYSKVKVTELDAVIRWNGEYPARNQNKMEKFQKVLKIANQKIDEANS